jgi:hypothetical protein
LAQRYAMRLAQVYTQAILERLATKQPGARTAFEGATSEAVSCVYRFPKLEPPPGHRGEIIRAAMIKTRQINRNDYETFCAVLDDLNDGLIPF